jgi:hypothetical protein
VTVALLFSLYVAGLLAVMLATPAKAWMALTLSWIALGVFALAPLIEVALRALT